MKGKGHCFSQREVSCSHTDPDPLRSLRLRPDVGARGELREDDRQDLLRSFELAFRHELDDTLPSCTLDDFGLGEGEVSVERRGSRASLRAREKGMGGWWNGGR